VNVRSSPTAASSGNIVGNLSNGALVSYYDDPVTPLSSDNKQNMWLKLVDSSNKYVAMRYLSANLLETSPGGTYSGNFHLTKEQTAANADYIYWYLSQRGWTKHAVCGLLGNFEAESEINPGVWENWSSSHTSANSYGLAQWDPSTKLSYWAPAHGYTADSLTGQLERIIVEGKSGVADPEKQWFGSSDSSMSYAQYIVSTQSAGQLARNFCTNYERPNAMSVGGTAKEDTLNNRATKANAWYSKLI
jgi:hypothetical protein